MDASKGLVLHYISPHQGVWTHLLITNFLTSLGWSKIWLCQIESYQWPCFTLPPQSHQDTFHFLAAPLLPQQLLKQPLLVLGIKASDEYSPCCPIPSSTFQQPAPISCLASHQNMSSFPTRWTTCACIPCSMMIVSAQLSLWFLHDNAGLFVHLKHLQYLLLYWSKGTEQFLKMYYN